MDLADVQELMGYKSATATQRYAMVAAKKLAAAARLLQEAWHPVGSTSDGKVGGRTGTE
jgi:site-specific recombinase XerD